MKKKIIVLILLLVVVLILIFVLKNGTKNVDFRTTKIERGTIESIISTTGTINPVNSVEVGSQVSGNILKLTADFNTQVKAGELIAEIDPSIYQARLSEAKANLLRGKVTLKQAERALQRGKELYNQKFISDTDLEDLEFAVETAEATLEQLKANYELAKTNLENCKIYSPIDGVVISRNIDVGQTVAASFQAPTLFVIAQDLSKMQIEVSIDEADIGRIEEGQSVKFDVDAYPGEIFRGRVTQVRLEPEIISNVVTYTVIVGVENREMKLKPGMTANVSVIEAERKNALKLPVSALRFNLPEELRNKYVYNPPSAKVKSEKDEAGLKKEDQAKKETQFQMPETREEMQQLRQKIASMSAEERQKLRERFQSTRNNAGTTQQKVQHRTLWVLRDDGKLGKKGATLGISDGDFIEIVGGGINEKDRVVIEVLVDGKPYIAEQGGFALPFGPGRGR